MFTRRFRWIKTKVYIYYYRVFALEPSIVWEFTELGDLIGESGKLNNTLNIICRNMFFSSLPDLEVESSVSLADSWYII